MGKINKSWYTSTTDEWATPQAVFDELNKEFCFTLDACASIFNHKVDYYFDKEMNGLEQNWGGKLCSAILHSHR